LSRPTGTKAARGPSIRLLAEIAVAVIVLLIPFIIGNDYYLFLLATIGIDVMVALGLNLLLGYGGQPSLAQGALVAVGAYTVGTLTVDHGWHFWTAAAVGIGLAVVVSLLVALPSFRISHWYFALISLAFALALQSALTQFTGITGGSAGLVGVPPVSIGSTALGGSSLLELIVVIDVLAFMLVRSVVRSRLGRGLVAIRDSELVARASGVNVVGLKLFAFAISAVFAGLAGALFASHTGVINPSEFDTNYAVLFLIIVLVGGSGGEWGPILGALVFVGLPDLLSFLNQWQALVYGVALIVVMIFAPRGINGMVQDAWSRLRDRIQPQEESSLALAAPLAGLPRPRPLTVPAVLRGNRGKTPDTPYRLTVGGVTRRFGGVVALDDISIQVAAGTVHALVGPNGSGKTTLLNVVSGYYRLDSGHIELDGRDITRASATARARAGIGRTFQTPRVIKTLSARENVMLGLYTRPGCTAAELVFRLPRAWHEERDQRRAAGDLLEFVGLAHVAESHAGDLPHGHQRLLEIARALAAAPGVLLLDEPAAGLSLAELDRLELLISTLRNSGLTVLVVEHHIDLVRKIADFVTVLDQGQVIAQGVPAEVFGLASVRASYLGTQA
jgi:branched-chain amino acid transport system permease protein